MKNRRFLAITLAVLIFFSFGFVTNVADNYFEISKNLDIFGKLYREINSLYVDDTDPTKLMQTGIDAMLNTLDPYTNYISENEVEDFQFMSTGQYGGVGAMIGKKGDRIMIMEPYEGYPADKGKLKAGDQLLKVDEHEINGEEMEVGNIRNFLRGEKGTPVELTVKREGVTEPLVVPIVRDQIKIKNVPYYGMVNDKIGYISLTGFTQDAGKEVELATKELKESHPNIGGIILDLRSNPGGRLDESVNVSNVFLPQKETIVETRGRMNGSKRTHLAQRIPVDTKIALAVLVNSRSASASEIVAGAIQDTDRGVIVGQRSFGKGLVQNIRPLSYNTQLKVTTAKYYTPSGRCIQAINYADRNEDGSVARIPDSLKNSFTTRNGRTVYDGGGIEPDIQRKKTSFQTVTQELDRQGLIFDYVTQFVSKHDEIAPAREFELTDADYQEFVQFVNGKDFDYETRADRQLDRLIETVEEESYSDHLQEDLQTLEEKLEDQKDKDLFKHKIEISRIISLEIATRYYYKSGMIMASLDDDEDIAAAVEILSDSEKYNRTLARASE